MSGSSNRRQALGWSFLVLSLLSSGPACGQTLALGGDINLARGAYQPGSAPFAGLRDALQADLVLSNLESPLTRQPRSTAGIDLRAPPEAAGALEPFSHLSTVNNHSLDGGWPGQLESRGRLVEAGVTPVTSAPIFSEVRGTTFALIAYLDHEGAQPPLAAVQAAAAKAQVVIVMPHWGAEYGGVTARQQEQARQLAAAGAALIVGSGPHVLQKHERLGQTLVFYSLGNLLFDQPYPQTWRGAVVRIRVEGEHLFACAVPTFSRSGRVRLATPAEGEQVLARLKLQPCGTGAT